MIVQGQLPTNHLLRGQLRFDEPMAKHVSWRAGGSLARAYFPADLDDLVNFLMQNYVLGDLYFFGLGSNLLIRDRGLQATGVFTHWALRKISLLDKGERTIDIYAQAGIASPKVARFAALQGAQGAEFLAGIPGTVGGALFMNAGCYGGQTWDIVTQVQTIDRQGVIRQRRPEEFTIGYRSVQAPAGESFVSATFRLPRGDEQESRLKIKTLLAQRISTQPLHKPNAGSVFRNPPGDFAARLIESCGLKGAIEGGAQISDKHANFIINNGGASATDIERLIDRARTEVEQQAGITLHCEVCVLGELA